MGGQETQEFRQGPQQEIQQTGKKHICLGLLAHVDAGKTTLAEGLLYTCGQLRRLGRVDHKDAFLDNFSLERERGITIFSKQARLGWKELGITLLDTPGHVDFSAEMERTLQVLDYALLVISGADGVQGHVQTLWKLLRQYEIPTFLFVNKMDQPGTDREALLKQLQEKLDESCVDGASQEELSMCQEELLEEYLEVGSVSERSVAEAVAARKIFPCYFGSALQLQGVEELLEGIRRYCISPAYPEKFGARVYKISRDEAGTRLTHLKVTGGSLRVKMPVDNRASARSERECFEEKADQLRIYDGSHFQTAEEVPAGEICAVTGLSETFAGQGLGAEEENLIPVLVPVLTYGLSLPQGCDPVKALGQLRQLEEEEPQLHVVWREAAKEIHVQVMGEIQIEILKRLLWERFGLEAEFTSGSILYQETLAAPVIGIGHFEPLRHYAEVHLLLEPGERGSGLQFASACSEDVLDKNWQRLILTHLEEKVHAGVLTGAPVTDLKVTLLKGRAHVKHTEGGDFRQATYRAFRQGLMRGQNVLLEPVFDFTLELPAENIGRAMADIQRMSGSFEPPQMQGEYSVLKGSVPVASLGNYQREINAYTRGRGRLTCELKGYEPCHNTEEVLARCGYQPEADVENPASSVFCAHGAGFVVGWDRVEEYAHLESSLPKEQTGQEQWDWGQTDGTQADGKQPEGTQPGWIQSGWKQPGQLMGAGQSVIPGAGRGRRAGSQTGSGAGDYITQEEIEEIFQRTYGKSAADYTPYRYHGRNTGTAFSGAGTVGGNTPGENSSEERILGENAVGGKASGEKSSGGKTSRVNPPMEEYLLVDGYNIIFAWEELRELAAVNIDSARDRLTDICSNFQGGRGGTLILVYDAYKVKGNPGSVQKYHNIYVVYTKEAETADQYIEKTVHKIGKKHRVTVATSDGLEQMIIWGEGAVRLSAREFYEVVEADKKRLREQYPVGGRLGAGLDLSGLEVTENQ